MNRKGLTKIGITFLMSIFVITAALLVNKAMGDEKLKPIIANDVNIKQACSRLVADPTLKVIVMDYIADWSHNNYAALDKSIDEAKRISQIIANRGIEKSRIILGMANKGSQFTDENPQITGDGIFLILLH